MASGRKKEGNPGSPGRGSRGWGGAWPWEGRAGEGRKIVMMEGGGRRP